MPIISQKNIDTYLKQFAHERYVQNLIRHTLRPILMHNTRFLTPIKTLPALKAALGKPPGDKLRHAFNQAREEWFKFTPTPELSQKISLFAIWLQNEVARIPHVNNTHIKELVRSKLTSAKTLEDVEHLTATSPRLIDDATAENMHLMSTLISEEKHGHIKIIAALPDQHVIVRIMSPSGMILAGKNADNCLGSRTFPQGSDTAYRYRVKYPDRWMFFQIRDCDNNPHATIGVETSTDGSCSIGAPPDSENYSDYYWDMKNIAQRIIIDKYNLKNVRGLGLKIGPENPDWKPYDPM